MKDNFALHYVLGSQNQEMKHDRVVKFEIGQKVYLVNSYVVANNKVCETCGCLESMGKKYKYKVVESTIRGFNIFENNSCSFNTKNSFVLNLCLIDDDDEYSHVCSATEVYLNRSDAEAYAITRTEQASVIK